MPWVEVRCPNEKCPGREVGHASTCTCEGTGRIEGEVPRTFEDCPDGDVVPERWMAFWRSTTLTRAGEWEASICCPACGEEGEESE